MEELLQKIQLLSPEQVETLINLLRVLIRISVAGIMLFGSLFVFIIWSQVRRTISNSKEDYGLLFISIAISMWFFMACNLLFVTDTIQRDIFQKILSTINNGLLLASLSYFKYGFEKYKKYITWFSLGLVLSLILIFVFVNEDKQAIFNLVVSLMVTMPFGYAVLYSFQKREYNYLGLGIIGISLICYASMQILI